MDKKTFTVLCNSCGRVSLREVRALVRALESRVKALEESSDDPAP